MPESNLPFKLIKSVASCRADEGTGYVWRLQRRVFDDEFGYTYRTIVSTSSDARAARWLQFYGANLGLMSGDAGYLSTVTPEEPSAFVPVALLVVFILNIIFTLGAAIINSSILLFFVFLTVCGLVVLGARWNNSRY